MFNSTTALLDVPQKLPMANRVELTEKIESTLESIQENALAPVVASVDGAHAVPVKSSAKPVASPNVLLRFRVRRLRRFMFEQILWTFAPPCVIAILFFMFRIADASQVGTYLLGFLMANLITSIVVAQSLERFAEPNAV